jgi:two-component sensor histidine kinase
MVFRAKIFMLFLPIWLMRSSLIAQEHGHEIKGPALDIDGYEKLINHYRYFKQDSAVYFSAKAMEFARRTKDSIGVGRILIEQGMIDDNQGRFEESEAKYKQALEIFQSCKYQKGIATAHIRLGVVKLRNGNYDKAIGDFLEALKVSETIGDKYGQMEANYSISWAYLDQKRYEPALNYLKLASALNDNLPFSNISLNIYNNFASAYRDLGDYQQAKQYAEKGVELSHKPEYQGLNITLINTLASIYAAQGFKDKAVALQLEALDRARSIDNYLRELQMLYGLARTYGKGDPAKAVFYLKQAADLAQLKKAHRQEMRYLKAMTEFYEQMGDFKNAYLTKSREHEIADSFYYKAVTQNITSLKAEYELSKSNARIKELNLIDHQRQLELEKSHIIRNVTFGGIAILLLILGLLYNQYTLKQRKNREISEKNVTLQRLLDEKEWLLKEIHHRVKNNLHTVMSLLESQSAYLENDALSAIRDSQHRVFAMSLIHQKLYQQEDVTTINMNMYLPELVNYLRESFNTRQTIRFKLQIDAIELDISQAIPLGLILNEAITNSVKYAFPGRNDGLITITMKHFLDGWILLTVTDDGIGLAPGFDSAANNSLGMRLMKGLSEDIDGKFNVESVEGTSIRIAFQKPSVLPEIQNLTTQKKSA